MHHFVFNLTPDEYRNGCSWLHLAVPMLGNLFNWQRHRQRPIQIQSHLENTFLLTLQLRMTLDSICNSCIVFFITSLFSFFSPLIQFYKFFPQLFLERYLLHYTGCTFWGFLTQNAIQKYTFILANLFAFSVFSCTSDYSIQKCKYLVEPLTHCMIAPFKFCRGGERGMGSIFLTKYLTLISYAKSAS